MLKSNNQVSTSCIYSSLVLSPDYILEKPERSWCPGEATSQINSIRISGLSGGVIEKAAAAAAAAKSSQSCPTLCDPIDGSPPGSPVPGILQARTLEWLAVSFSNAWKGKVKVKSLSRVRLFATPWSSAYQAPPSMGFSRQEYWSGVPLYIPGTYFTTEHLYFLMFIISTKFLHKIQRTWKISLIRCCTGIFDSPPIKLYQLEKDTSDFWGNRFLPQSIQPSGINLLYKEIFKVFPQILSQCYCE